MGDPVLAALLAEAAEGQTPASDNEMSVHVESATVQRLQFDCLQESATTHCPKTSQVQ
jgi:hypothetical protein